MQYSSRDRVCLFAMSRHNSRHFRTRLPSCWPSWSWPSPPPTLLGRRPPLHPRRRRPSSPWRIQGCLFTVRQVSKNWRFTVRFPHGKDADTLCTWSALLTASSLTSPQLWQTSVGRKGCLRYTLCGQNTGGIEARGFQLTVHCSKQKSTAVDKSRKTLLYQVDM